jgi:hypothetical protein
LNYLVGDSATAPVLGEGYVTHWMGAPEGDSAYLVRSAADGQTAMQFRSGEIAAGPPVPEFEIDDEVRLFGAPGRIVAHDGDAYAVEVLRRRRSGLEFRDFYPSVPAWVLVLGYT